MALFRSKGAFKDAIRGTAPIEVRKADAWLFAGIGVLPGSASPLVTGTAGWAYSVGAAGFVTSRGASDGVHLFGNDGTVTVGATGVDSTVPVAPSAGLQRIDIIWVKHPSAGENSDTISEPSFGVASGTAASTALAPTIPTGALEIGRNLMTSSATSTSSVGNSITQSAVTARLRAPQVVAVAGSLSGAWAGQMVIQQAGRVAATSDASGRYLLTFPVAFPSGLVSVWTTMDDPTTAKHRWIVDAGFGAGAPATWMKLVDTTTGLPIPGVTSVLSWLAVGF